MALRKKKMVTPGSKTPHNVVQSNQSTKGSNKAARQMEAGIRGQQYAAAQPKNVPSFTFNKDGSVDYTSPEGSPIRLSKEEYKASVSGKGMMTPGVERVRKERDISSAKEALLRNEATAAFTPVSELKAQKEQQKLAQKGALEQVGQPIPGQEELDVVPENPFDKAKVLGTAASTAVTAGVAAATPLGLTTAGTIAGATGLTAATVATGGVALLASIAAVTTYSLIERNDAKKAIDIFSSSKTAMNAIITGINRGEIPYEDYPAAIEAFNQQKANILSAQSNLKKQTSNDLKKFLSGADGKAFEVNNYVENTLPFIEDRLNSAIATPNPNAAIPEALL